MQNALWLCCKLKIWYSLTPIEQHIQTFVLWWKWILAIHTGVHFFFFFSNFTTDIYNKHEIPVFHWSSPISSWITYNWIRSLFFYPLLTELRLTSKKNMPDCICYARNDDVIDWWYAEWTGDCCGSTPKVLQNKVVA